MPKTDKQKIFASKTKSKIPKSAREKRMWIQARKLTAEMTGRYAEENIPWGLVTHIYQDEIKGNKIIKKSDIKNAKISQAVRSYKTNKKRKKS